MLIVLTFDVLPEGGSSTVSHTLALSRQHAAAYLFYLYSHPVKGADSVIFKELTF